MIEPNMLSKVVFLDRDGVINKDSSGYIKALEEFEFLPGSLEAMVRLTKEGFNTIIITNQSGVNRNLISLETLNDIHSKLHLAVTDSGGDIKDIFFCPHHPDENCACRKPKSGMILQAVKQYKIDLSSATMVGDSAKDIMCARNAGCGAAVLVKTGNGLESEKILSEKNISPDYVAEDLSAAVEWIVSRK